MLLPWSLTALLRMTMASCFFFQAEDGIRDVAVTGVQTCALPIFETGIGFRYFTFLDDDARRLNAGFGKRTLGLLQPVLCHGAVGDDGGPHAGAQRGDAGAERLQHATADDDVVGALAKRDVDRDIGGMFQWRSHGVTLIPSVVGWAEGATAHSRARRASIHSSTMRSCGTSREAIVRSAVR